MSTEEQFTEFKKLNQWAKGMSFDTWKSEILKPKLEKIKEEIKKLNDNESDTTHDNIRRGDNKEECTKPD
jgi:hypothetical protein